MELLGIDGSRIVFLTQVNRAAGQLYLPDAAAKLVQRYSFVKYPPVDELARDSYAFSVGKFNDVQINELHFYNDGIIVAARAPTEVLDAFISDLFKWAGEEFGIVQASVSKPEKFIESSIIVRSTRDLATAVSPKNDVAQILNRTFGSVATDEGPYKLSGLVLDCDPVQFAGRRKPMRFAIERRISVPFAENVFYSHAPLHTTDHLRVLGELEALSIA